MWSFLRPPLRAGAAAAYRRPTPPASPPASPQLEEMRKNEDPRLSFSTPEFKEAQRQFTDGFKARRRRRRWMAAAGWRQRLGGGGGRVGSG